MKRTIFYLYMLLSLLTGVCGLFGVGEKTLNIGSSSGWSIMEARSGLVELPELRPYPVLALSSAGKDIPTNYQADLYLSFDEGSPARFADLCGHYSLSPSPYLRTAAYPLARQGEGAVHFIKEAPLTIRPGPGALFARGSHIQDFSLEFWLYPMSLENGEQILSFSSSHANGQGTYNFRRFQCVSSRNRLQWIFSDFFSDSWEQVPDQRIITLTGSPIMPKTWSHHLIRFNSELGLLEYLVDSRTEALIYVTSTGREGGEVYTPVIGEDCSLILGSRYTGLMDEFRISGQYQEKPVLSKYLPQGGHMESRTIDLGSPGNRILKLEARGGRIQGNTAKAKNEYAGPGSLCFDDYSELRFFIRLSNNPYQWNNVPWIPVEKDSDLGENLSGRYVQLAVEFYPSGDGETSPYLEELRLVYRGDEPLHPPGLVTALARDGAVELSWKGVQDSNLGGYLVYYGSSREEYFGEPGAVPSPVNAGNKTSLRIEGLQNGVLYYFAVASYDKILGETGEFSREAAARPRKESEVRP